MIVTVRAYSSLLAAFFALFILHPIYQSSSLSISPSCIFISTSFNVSNTTSSYVLMYPSTYIHAAI